IRRAALLGIPAIAIADENSVAGIVRAHTQAREIARLVKLAREARKDPVGPPRPAHIPPPPSADITATPRLMPAARIVLRDGFGVTAIARNRTGWKNLCRLISLGRQRVAKGSCLLTMDDLVTWGADLVLLLQPPQTPPERSGAHAWLTRARRLTRRFADQTFLLMAPHYDGQDPVRFERLTGLAARLKIPTVASAAPLMHHGARRKLTDVLCAVRTGKRVDNLGRAALSNAERRLRSEAEMLQLFANHTGAVRRAGDIAARCTFSLDQLAYEYPSEVASGETPASRLSRLAHEGLKWRYPAGAPDKVKAMLSHELALISKLRYEPYFLTVRDVVAFARSRGILCQGRGSAANSVTCYALGVTSVSPEI
ncbi:MAG: error-prone DNA polymerase, partial [Paracoccaceae bacterium]